MTQHVVKIVVDANIAGSKLSVQSATIKLGINAIPTIELLVAPTNDVATPLRPKVFKPSIHDFSRMYKVLSQEAQGLHTKGNVNISITTDGAPKPENIELKNWILSGVGMSNVSSTAAPNLVVVLQHPICMLTKIGSIYETPRGLLDERISLAVKGKSSFLDIVMAVYDSVRSDDAFYPTPSKMPRLFRERLGTGEFSPTEYLHEVKEGLFLQKFVDDEGIARLAASISRMVLPSDGGSSTWDMIVGAAGSLLLNVVQNKDFNFTTDQLVIEPMKPWKSCTLTLDDDRCQWTELPGMDTFKLVGVMARAFAPFNEAITLGFKKLGTAAEDEKENQIHDVLYIPEDLKPESADGRIMKTSAPIVLDQAFREDAACGSNISEAGLLFSRARKGGFNKALYQYCKAVYEISAGSMLTAKAQMSLGFKDSNGELILPGNTCKFTSGGNDIYFAYVRQVVHTLSATGACSTSISMTHVRPEEKFKIMRTAVIKDGDVNAAYSAN